MGVCHLWVWGGEFTFPGWKMRASSIARLTHSQYKASAPSSPSLVQLSQNSVTAMKHQVYSTSSLNPGLLSPINVQPPTPCHQHFICMQARTPYTRPHAALKNTVMVWLSAVISVDLNSLGQSDTVVGPVKDAVVHSDEDISQDPEVCRAILEAAHAGSLVILHLSQRRQMGKRWLSSFFVGLLSRLMSISHGEAKAVRATGESKRTWRLALLPWFLLTCSV